MIRRQRCGRYKGILGATHRVAPVCILKAVRKADTLSAARADDRIQEPQHSLAAIGWAPLFLLRCSLASLSVLLKGTLLGLYGSIMLNCLSARRADRSVDALLC